MGIALFQGRFICRECGEAVRFYKGHDSEGPERCSQHQGVRPR